MAGLSFFGSKPPLHYPLFARWLGLPLISKLVCPRCRSSLNHTDPFPPQLRRPPYSFLAIILISFWRILQHLMGILDYLPGRSNNSDSNPYHENPTRSSDGAYIAPDRSTREKCYEARDTFFACLEQHGIVDSLKRKDEAEKVCGEEDRALAKECAASWVSLARSPPKHPTMD